MSWPKGKPRIFSEEHKLAISKAKTGVLCTKKRVLSEEHKVAIAKAKTGTTASIETRKKMSLSAMGNKNSVIQILSEEGRKGRAHWLGKIRPEETGKRISAALIGHKISEKTLAAMKAKKSPEHCKKIAESCIARNENNAKFDTYPERCIKKLLDESGIEYLFQKGLYGFLVDFYIPSLKVVIEVDGVYWHGHPDYFNENDSRVIRNIERDKRENKIMKERGYKLIRIWENKLPTTLKELVELW